MDASTSFAAWIAALNRPHDRALLAAAVDPQARIERHAPLDRAARSGEAGPFDRTSASLRDAARSGEAGPFDRTSASLRDAARSGEAGPFDRGEAPAPVEVIVGVAAIAAWLGRLRRPTTFALAGTPRADGDTWTVEYELYVEELDFRNGGLWVARLADDGRIAVLSHRPFSLPAADAR